MNLAWPHGLAFGEYSETCLWHTIELLHHDACSAAQEGFEADVSRCLLAVDDQPSQVVFDRHRWPKCLQVGGWWLALDPLRHIIVPVSASKLLIHGPMPNE